MPSISQQMRDLGIDHRLTTAYHPQANGLDERFNQTLVNTLSKYTQEKRPMWDENSAEVVYMYAYNTTVQESTKHTLYEVMFGRMACLPVDFNSAKHYDPDAALEEYRTGKEGNKLELCGRREMEQAIKKNTAKAQTKKKQYYDQRHGAASCFGIGLFVLKKHFTRSKRKGGPAWTPIGRPHWSSLQPLRRACSD